jgi:O-antigen ligase
MTQTPKEKAKELITHYHNLIQEIGGELGQEILVSILARHCALFAAKRYESIMVSKQKIVMMTYYFWEEVEHEIENYED